MPALFKGDALCCISTSSVPVNAARVSHDANSPAGWLEGRSSKLYGCSVERSCVAICMPGVP